MRVALVHDWLTGMRGGEKVLEVFAAEFPGADLFTLVHVPGSVSPGIEDRPIHTSPLNRLPGVERHYRKFLPLFPALIERFDLSGFDFVLSTSSCVAKGARPAPGAIHVSYVFSPMRYVWDRYEDYFGPGAAPLPTRLAMRLCRGPLRRWDRDSAGRVDTFVADSHFVAGRIRTYYGRDAEVIHAPVDDALFRPVEAPPRREWLVVSAFAPYKKVDVAIEAARLADVPLLVVGAGPEEARLRRIAGSGVTFLGWVPDDELARLYSSCRGLLFPGVEDFGITPLESMACGRPVLAYGEGGALETVVGARWDGDRAGVDEGATGLFVRAQTPAAFADAIRAAEAGIAAIDAAACRRRAESFGLAEFRRKIRAGLARWTTGRSGRAAGRPAGRAS